MEAGQGWGRVAQNIVKILTFIIGQMGSCWRVLSRGVPWSDCKWIALTAVIQAKDDGSLTKRIAGEFVRSG